jgi:hypothetical protein
MNYCRSSAGVRRPSNVSNSRRPQKLFVFFFGYNSAADLNKRAPILNQHGTNRDIQIAYAIES